jgi:serine/threonine-protein kinase
MVLMESIGGLNYSIGLLSMEGDHKRTPLIQERSTNGQPQISRDGRWVAYMSTESGKPEIYVRPFPDVNLGKFKVSTSGGDSPLWSPDGRELFYRSGDSVIAVSVQTAPTFKPGKPGILFQGTYVSASLQDAHTWDISPDGKRFLMMKATAAIASAEEGPRRINIVLNWIDELKQRVPVK